MWNIVLFAIGPIYYNQVAIISTERGEGDPYDLRSLSAKMDRRKIGVRRPTLPWFSSIPPEPLQINLSGEYPIYIIYIYTLKFDHWGAYFILSVETAK